MTCVGCGGGGGGGGAAGARGEGAGAAPAAGRAARGIVPADADRVGRVAGGQAGGERPALLQRDLAAAAQVRHDGRPLVTGQGGLVSAGEPVTPVVQRVHIGGLGQWHRDEAAAGSGHARGVEGDLRAGEADLRRGVVARHREVIAGLQQGAGADLQVSVHRLGGEDDLDIGVRGRRRSRQRRGSGRGGRGGCQHAQHPAAALDHDAAPAGPPPPVAGMSSSPRYARKMTLCPSMRTSLTTVPRHVKPRTRPPGHRNAAAPDAHPGPRAGRKRI